MLATILVSMGHEHNGECCGQAEAQQHEPHHEHGHEHDHNLVGHIGASCCSGACGHPEHMLGIGFLEAQRLLDNELEDDENDVLDIKKKKKRQTYGEISVKL